MIVFRDGPAAGHGMHLRSAPLLLRVTRDPKGDFDALDQPEDCPRKNETIFVYIRCNKPFVGFIDWHDGRGRRGEPFVNAEYRLLSHQPDDSIVRDEDYWRAFYEGAVEQAGRS